MAALHCNDIPAVAPARSSKVRLRPSCRPSRHLYVRASVGQGLQGWTNPGGDVGLRDRRLGRCSDLHDLAGRPHPWRLRRGNRLQAIGFRQCGLTHHRHRSRRWFIRLASCEMAQTDRRITAHEFRGHKPPTRPCRAVLAGSSCGIYYRAILERHRDLPLQ